MGFFDVLGRIVRGEPGFQDENKSNSEASAASASPASPAEPTINKGDEHTFPVVYMKQLKPHVNGAKLELYCQIENAWSAEVELDKIRIFNIKRELDTKLRAGETREFLVYSGPVLTHEYHEAQLDYKTKDGDYFSTTHEITFAYNAQDKTYLPSDVHLDEPVRDIYG